MAEASVARITKRAVDGTARPTKGESRLWDSEMKGFFLRVYPSGRRVYALRYRRGTAQRVLTIGVHGSPWTPETARQRAREAMDAVHRGEDPAAAKREARAAPSVTDLIDAYLTDGPAAKPGKRQSSWQADASNLRHHIGPLLGKKSVQAVTKEQAARAISDIAAGKTATGAAHSGKKRGRVAVQGGEGIARRTKLAAAAMFAWGLEHGRVTGDNPFARVKLTAPPVRERFLTREEAVRLLGALADLESEADINPTFADAIRLLMLTGARKTEVLGLRWAEVDLDRNLLRLPPERTKAGGKTGARRIVLSPPAVEIIERRQVEKNRSPTFVFPGNSGPGHAISLRQPFKRACERAGLKDLRIHDLRHSFASFAVADGASLFLVAKLLGHASSRTTERYAHLSGDPLHEAVTAIGRKLGVDRGGERGQRPSADALTGLRFEFTLALKLLRWTICPHGVAGPVATGIQLPSARRGPEWLRRPRQASAKRRCCPVGAAAATDRGQTGSKRRWT